MVSYPQLAVKRNQLLAAVVGSRLPVVGIVTVPPSPEEQAF
jgi:hypothetical protein